MPAGRPPKPTAAKIAQGNPGRRPLNDREPDARIIAVLPRAPKELTERASRCWREYGNELIRAGLLTALGLPALRRWCIAFDNYETARELVQKTGIVLVNKATGSPYLNPAYVAQGMASKELRACETEFGMTPAAATKVKVANPKQMDLFGDFLAGNDDSVPDELMN
jgi:P27 family predicted phage terminase small subunit